MRYFKLCGNCRSVILKIDSGNYLCANKFTCQSCGAYLVLVDTCCESCQKRIECLALPSIVLISEVEYFFPPRRGS